MFCSPKVIKSDFADVEVGVAEGSVLQGSVVVIVVEGTEQRPHTSTVLLPDSVSWKCERVNERQ